MNATECLINPERGRGEAKISGTVLFCPNPNETLTLGHLAKELGWRRHFLYNSSLWSLSEGWASLCGPAVGAPMAAMTLEKLIALGGQRFVVFGSCGALSSSLAVGDVFLPTWAVSQEGTSQHYPLTATPRPSASLQEALTVFLNEEGIPVKHGGVWTTDAPYRERRETIRRYRAQGLLAVDMEFSALITVAAFRQVELAAVMVVSDLLCADLWQPGFRTRAFKSGIQTVGSAVFSGLASGRL